VVGVEEGKMKPVFRMSQSGWCPRRLSATILGVKEKLEAPVWLERAAREGTVHEELVKRDLRVVGCDIVREQEEVREDFSLFTLLGHLDGLVRLSEQVLEGNEFEVNLVDQPDFSLDSYYPIEIKSFGFPEWQRWKSDRFEAFPAYAAQASCYMHALSSDIMAYVVKDRSGGLKQLFVLGRPPVDIEVVWHSLGLVVDAVRVAKLVEREYNPDDRECRRCEFRASICKPEAVVIEDEDLERVLASYVESRDVEKAAKAEMEKCRELILAYGKDRFKLGRYLASISWVDREGIKLQDVVGRFGREAVEDIVSKSRFPRLSVTDLEAM